MLSKEENELITRVGRGTPMGEVFRRYWLPAMLSEELPEPDCPPVKLRLQGEVDSSHAPFLHGSVGPDGMLAYNGNVDRHPVFSVVETDYGTAIAARRDAPNDQYYWRITPFMLPSYTIVPRARQANYIFT